MSFLPIAQRELRLASRRSRIFWVRGASGMLAAATALAMLSPSVRGMQPPDAAGAQLFGALSAAGFALCLFAGAFVTADCLSSEKREGTLGLLFLTQLRGYDVVFGKLIATSLNPFYGLMAAVPVLALPIVLGGVTAGEFWRMALVLINTLFLSLAGGMLVSAVSRNGPKAIAGTLLLLLGVAIFPGYAFHLVFDRNFIGGSIEFAVMAGSTHALGWVCLAAASRLLPRRLGDAPVQAPSAKPPALLATFRREESAEDKAKRELCLSDNPVLWLARRERHRHALFWGFMVSAACAWLIGYGVLGAAWLRAELVFGTTLLVHAIIKCWVALEASRRLSQGRQSGELELLLVTPLNVQRIADGRMTMLKRFFLVPIGLVFAVDVGLLFFGMGAPGGRLGAGALWMLGFLATIGVFVADCYAMSWAGLWHGLTALNPTQAFLKTLFKVLVVPWVVFVVGLPVVPVVAVMFGVAPSPVAWWVFVNVANSYLLCSWARNRLQSDLRAAVVGDARPEAGKLFWSQIFPQPEPVSLTPSNPAPLAER